MYKAERSVSRGVGETLQERQRWVHSPWDQKAKLSPWPNTGAWGAQAGQTE